jgi:hypothetical protein
MVRKRKSLSHWGGWRPTKNQQGPYKCCQAIATAACQRTYDVEAPEVPEVEGADGAVDADDTEDPPAVEEEPLVAGAELPAGAEEPAAAPMQLVVAKEYFQTRNQ